MELLYVIGAIVIGCVIGKMVFSIFKEPSGASLSAASLHGNGHGEGRDRRRIK